MLMVTLLLSTAALVLLTALGAGALLCVAASSEELDKSEEAAWRAANKGAADRGDRRG
jgi:hypothetical protein